MCSREHRVRTNQNEVEWENEASEPASGDEQMRTTWDISAGWNRRKSWTRCTDEAKNQKEKFRESATKWHSAVLATAAAKWCRARLRKQREFSRGFVAVVLAIVIVGRLVDSSSLSSAKRAQTMSLEYIFLWWEPIASSIHISYLYILWFWIGLKMTQIFLIFISFHLWR